MTTSITTIAAIVALGTAGPIQLVADESPLGKAEEQVATRMAQIETEVQQAVAHAEAVVAATEPPEPPEPPDPPEPPEIDVIGGDVGGGGRCYWQGRNWCTL